ncbi:pyridoxal phosphate phosphatase PHOSPHO2-like [Mizuhopecten yessoensis]|uniref:Pyridoxal phosphate phosphatase PHOSPHO2 n=1 Tax=Mizuhopecten yessoensis TaxID=6573 RepID=A0A210PGP5_MIZYE|nr:pyridoxal phosphate phosphatase PHOSPHO2-like [Mizuhopecten yessoensis]OWF35641.1 Pyridoxal phosphate phosphatase PHOSPHO2 [Mizuhopecten yessoensis]
MINKLIQFITRRHNIKIEKMTGRLLLAFDFDHTMVEENSDLWVKRLAPGGELPQEIEDKYSNDGWTDYMATIFEFLHGTGIRQPDFKQCLAEIPLTVGFKHLLEHVHKQGHECIIISDSNSTFIRYLLEQNNLENMISKVYTNPAKFDEEGCLRIDFYHHQDWCDLSTVNLCKGHILTEHIREQAEQGRTYSHVLYVGDGSNDLCPSLTLSDKDYACPRVNLSMWKKINAILAGDDNYKQYSLKANVLEWESGADILKLVKELESGKS